MRKNKKCWTPLTRSRVQEFQLFNCITPPLEKSKTFRELARIANCEDLLWYDSKASRRGLIAIAVLGYLKELDRRENELFAEQCRKLI